LGDFFPGGSFFTGNCFFGDFFAGSCFFGDGLGGRNLALPGAIDQNARDLDQVLTFADAAGIESVFLLPGIVNPGQSRADAARTSAESLTALLAVASHHRAKICIEPHVQSWAESPALVQRLIDDTGIGLALDYSHFACLGYRQDEVDPLAKHAVHVHLRQARMGALQASERAVCVYEAISVEKGARRPPLPAAVVCPPGGRRRRRSASP
jgi:sugar phosphate isomerase/epimerase